jgi:3-deoxy-D-manno-octulosonic-acid transferase
MAIISTLYGLVTRLTYGLLSAFDPGKAQAFRRRGMWKETVYGSYTRGKPGQNLDKPPSKLKRYWQGQKLAQSGLDSFLIRHWAAYGHEPPIWMHCASLGEFEQGRPVLEVLASKYPKRARIVTFSSPSGYEARARHPLPHLVTYLPPDTPRLAQRWAKRMGPALILWVRYEFWLNHLKAAQAQGSRLYLISTKVKPAWFTGLRKGLSESALEYFRHIFCQTQADYDLLPPLFQQKAQVSGDTRYDRAILLTKSHTTVPELAQFAANGQGPILIAGSVWMPDLQVLLPAVAVVNTQRILAGDLPIRLVLFPHEFDGAEIAYALENGPKPVVIASQLNGQALPAECNTLVIDRVGVLAQSYPYGLLAWVGGAFGKGLHNIIEAAAWGVPVLYGPAGPAFPEAESLAVAGGGSICRSQEVAVEAIKMYLHPHSEAGLHARNWVEHNAGATDNVVELIIGEEIDGPV